MDENYRRDMVADISKALTSAIEEFETDRTFTEHHKVTLTRFILLLSFLWLERYILPSKRIFQRVSLLFIIIIIEY